MNKILSVIFIIVVIFYYSIYCGIGTATTNNYWLPMDVESLEPGFIAKGKDITSTYLPGGGGEENNDIIFFINKTTNVSIEIGTSSQTKEIDMVNNINETTDCNKLINDEFEKNPDYNMITTFEFTDNGIFVIRYDKIGIEVAQTKGFINWQLPN